MALVVALALAAWDGLRWQQAVARDARIATASADALREDPAPAARFALARLLEAGGNWQAAVEIYQGEEAAADPALANAARYNGGNVLLREALQRGDDDQIQRLTLANLAKRRYREVLEHEPQHWNARYNLERALVLAPERAGTEAQADPAPLDSERAVTTMRGFSLGLP